MTLKHFYIIHVGLPVFDVALVVARQHPLFVVAPNHRPHCTIMRLSNFNFIIFILTLV